MDSVKVYFTSGLKVEFLNVEKIVKNPFDSTTRFHHADGEDSLILGSKIDYMKVGKDIDVSWRKDD